MTTTIVNNTNHDLHTAQPLTNSMQLLRSPIVAWAVTTRTDSEGGPTRIEVLPVDLFSGGMGANKAVIDDRSGNWWIPDGSFGIGEGELLRYFAGTVTNL